MAEQQQLQLFDLALKVVSEYDGNVNSLYRFINAVSSVVTQYYVENDVNNFQNVIIINGIIGKLRGKALNLIDVNSANTWARIIAVLIENFSDQRDENSLNRDLVNLYQGNESPQQFYDRCVSLLTTVINYINIHNEDANLISCKRDFFTAQALKTFLAGLKEPLGSTIRAMRPNSLPAALQYIKEEANIMYLQKRNQPQNQPSNQNYGFNTPRFPPNQFQQRNNFMTLNENRQFGNRNNSQNFQMPRPNNNNQIQSQPNRTNYFYQDPNITPRPRPTPMSGISYSNAPRNNNNAPRMSGISHQSASRNYAPSFIPNPNFRPQQPNPRQPNYFQNVGHYPDFAFEEMNLHQIENTDLSDQNNPRDYQPHPIPTTYKQAYECEVLPENNQRDVYEICNDQNFPPASNLIDET